MVRVSPPTLLGLDVARAIAEAIHFVVADERLTAGIANDDPAGLGDDRAAALLAFAALAAEVFKALRSRTVAAPGAIGVSPPGPAAVRAAAAR